MVIIDTEEIVQIKYLEFLISSVVNYLNNFI